MNQKGMQALGAWGLVSIFTGCTGYITAKQDDWKCFHETNIACGITNTGIAAISLTILHGQQAEKTSIKESYRHYLSGKNFYLISASADILITGTGLVLLDQGQNNKTNSSIYTGAGRSLCLQGLTRLLLDDVMYFAHIRDNSKWYDIISDLQYIGNGVSFNYKFR